MDYRQRISLDPLIRGGKPCVRGTRIAVTDVIDYLAGGMTVTQVLNDFPDLTANDIHACVRFTGDGEGDLPPDAA